MFLNGEYKIKVFLNHNSKTTTFLNFNVVLVFSRFRTITSLDFK